MTDADVVIVGGGPAGLTAAIYLARFHLRTIVIDAGESRARMIPVSHNHAGHPAGIAGEALLARMRAQATGCGAELLAAEVTGIAPRPGGFAVTADATRHARAVLLATGVHNRRPPMDADVHDEAVARGLVRYCPICDGFEITDMRIAVLGSGDHGLREAIFLRSYSRDVTLVAPDRRHRLDSAQRESLADAGIVVIDGPATGFRIEGDKISLATSAGLLCFDTLYPALGSIIRSGLAVQLGVDLADAGCIRVDSHQRTGVAGLYAAGDNVPGLDQISTAMGQAAIAATAIRNDLAEASPLRR